MSGNGIIGAVGISGLPGSDKSSIIEELLRRHRLEVFHIGGEFRKRWEVWSHEQVSEETSDVGFEEWWRDYVTDEDIRIINGVARGRLTNGNVILDSKYLQVN